MTIEIRTAREDDLYHIAPRMREADAVEVMASGGYTPLEALLVSHRSSLLRHVAHVDGCPEAAFGWAPHPMSRFVGVAWFLGTDEVLNHAFPMIREARKYVRMADALFHTQIAAVHAENTQSRKWLRILGFQDEGPLPVEFSRDGSEFRLFKRCVNQQP